MLVYSNNFVTLYCGDCLEIMKELPDGCVDLTITSPPFNLGNKHHTGNYYHTPYEDDMPEQDYQDWQVNVLNELYRVTAKQGSLWYQHKNRIRQGVSITPYQWILRTSWIVKQEVVWRNRSQNFDKIRFYPMTERIYWLAKSPSTKLYNAVNMHDDWHINPVGSKGKHTRAFPTELVNNILLCFEEAKTILDPFLGSGTTIYCARKLGKKVIGIEKRRDYLNISIDRCKREGIL